MINHTNKETWRAIATNKGGKTMINSMIEHFAECDRIASEPLSLSERLRLESLRSTAQSTGLGGKERGEFLLLSMRLAEEEGRRP